MQRVIKILVVEDHAEIRRLIRMTLEVLDCEVTEANNGERGLEAAARVVPDVMLLDVMMPGAIDGLEVCRRVKADPKTAAVKIVLLTALGAAADRKRGDAAGADAYVVKPFSAAQLLQTVTLLSTGAVDGD